MTPRELAEKVVADWERHARAETYLPESLHWKAKGWLVDAIEAAIVSRETPDGEISPEHIDEFKKHLEGFGRKPRAKRSAG